MYSIQYTNSTYLDVGIWHFFFKLEFAMFNKWSVLTYKRDTLIYKSGKRGIYMPNKGARYRYSRALFYKTRGIYPVPSGSAAALFITTIPEIMIAPYNRNTTVCVIGVTAVQFKQVWVCLIGTCLYTTSV